MSLSTDFMNDFRAARKLRLGWRGLLIVFVITLIVVPLFDHFGRPDLAEPTLVFVGGLGFVLAVKWKLRRRVWFWIVLTIIAALHAVVLWQVRWTTNWIPAAALAGGMSIDICAMLWVLDAVGRVTEGQPTADR